MRPLRHLSKVLLPQPLGPAISISSPFGKLKEIFSIACGFTWSALSAAVSSSSSKERYRKLKLSTNTAGEILVVVGGGLSESASMLHSYLALSSWINTIWH